MKKGTKWFLWILGIIFSTIVLSFYLNYFTFAYALMGVLLLIFSGWGAIAQLKNDSYQFEAHRQRERNIQNLKRLSK